MLADSVSFQQHRIDLGVVDDGARPLVACVQGSENQAIENWHNQILQPEQNCERAQIERSELRQDGAYGIEHRLDDTSQKDHNIIDEPIARIEQTKPDEHAHDAIEQQRPGEELNQHHDDVVNGEDQQIGSLCQKG